MFQCGSAQGDHVYITNLFIILCYTYFQYFLFKHVSYYCKICLYLFHGILFRYVSFCNLVRCLISSVKGAGIVAHDLVSSALVLGPGSGCCLYFLSHVEIDSYFALPPFFCR